MTDYYCFSPLLSYNGLGQLIDAVSGVLNPGLDAIQSGTKSGQQTWNLPADGSGNWDRFRQDHTGQGYDQDQTRTHNAANEITAIGVAAGSPW